MTPRLHGSKKNKTKKTRLQPGRRGPQRLSAGSVTVNHAEALGLVVMSVPAEQSLPGLLAEEEHRQFFITEELNEFP